MKMENFNAAQMLLVTIGGTAELVAGHMGHYYSDQQTSKKTPQRPLVGRGNYGKNLLAHFAGEWVKKHSKKV